MENTELVRIIERCVLEGYKRPIALKHFNNDRVAAQALERMYQGSVGIGLARDALLEMGITHVLLVADDVVPFYPQDFTYKTVVMKDARQTDLEAYFPECFEFLHSAMERGKVLVHW